MAYFLRDAIEQLNLHKLSTSVPTEQPTEIWSGDLLRLTSTNNIASSVSMCTKDDTSCSSYSSNSVNCTGAKNQFGIAMVGACAF